MRTKIFILSLWVGCLSFDGAFGQALIAPTGNEWHVTTAGTPDGDGTRQRPWDLKTALAHPSSVKPGDTIWIGGGTYIGSFTSTLTGAEGKPITVRAMPGERVIVDKSAPGMIPAVFSVGKPREVSSAGSWTVYWGLEVTNSHSIRIIAESGSNPLDKGRATGLEFWASNVKAINMVVHNNGSGCGAASTGQNVELYGSIIFDNGWLAPDRGHGHGLYWQNKDGWKRIEDCIVFRGFNHGIHAYGSGDGAWVNGFNLVGNIVFLSGILQGKYERNFLLGGGITCKGNTVQDNLIYTPADSDAMAMQIGYQTTPATDTTVTGNYLSGLSRFILWDKPPQEYGLSVNGNTYLTGVDSVYERKGHRSGISEFPDNTIAPHGVRPTGVKILVRPNRYEPGRANVAVFNWDLRESVELDVSSVLKAGDRYELRDVQNLFGNPVASGTIDGSGKIAIKMTGLVAAPPSGRLAEPGMDFKIAPPKHTAPEFGAFILVRK